MMEIQGQMSDRAIELLSLPEDKPCLILDIGCGSGLSGECIEEQGHFWIGMDISRDMLGKRLLNCDSRMMIPPLSLSADVARDREVEGDLVHSDMGDGVPFRPGSFDGAISISALQWLCNADKTYHRPHKRLYKFFSTLYASLVRIVRISQACPYIHGNIHLLSLRN